MTTVKTIRVKGPDHPFTVEIMCAEGKEVRLRRRSLGWTQKELARKANVPSTFVSIVERFKIDHPRKQRIWLALQDGENGVKLRPKNPRESALRSQRARAYKQLRVALARNRKTLDRCIKLKAKVDNLNAKLGDQHLVW